MPDLYVLPRIPTTAQPVPERPICRPGAKRPEYVPGTPVMIGWPVLMSCPAKKHNTLEHARPRGQRYPQCICPRGRQLYQAYLDNGRRKYRENNPERRPQGQPYVSRARTPQGAANAQRAAQVRKENADKLRMELLTALQAVPRLSGDEPACTPELLPIGVSRDDFFHEGNSNADAMKRNNARKVCRSCPIQEKCLKDAVERGEPHGIFGGLDERERRNPQRVAMEMRAIRR